MKNIYITFIALCLSLGSIAQEGTYETIRDFEAWTAAELHYKPTKKIKLSLQQQLRLKDDASTVDQYFTQFDFRYKLAKGLYLTPAVRYIRENDDQGKIQGYENHLRWNADLTYKHDIKRFTLRYRTRYQSKQELQVEDENTNVFRAKAAVHYNIKNWKLDPDFAAEFFNELGEASEWYRVRWTLGTDYKLKNAGELGLCYRIEQELTGANPKTTHILFLKYGYTLKKAK